MSADILSDGENAFHGNAPRGRRFVATGGAAAQPTAEPVEGHLQVSHRPEGAKDSRHWSSASPEIPLPHRGRFQTGKPQPRVPLRCTRGYSPRPRRGRTSAFIRRHPRLSVVLWNLWRNQFSEGEGDWIQGSHQRSQPFFPFGDGASTGAGGASTPALTALAAMASGSSTTSSRKRRCCCFRGASAGVFSKCIARSSC